MNHLHKRERLEKGDVVEVNCSHQCHIRLLDDTNYRAYKSGRPCKQYGDFYRKLPARIAAPHSGYWNIVIDLGGGTAQVRHSIQIIKAA